MSEPRTPDTSAPDAFGELGLLPALCRSVEQAGYTEPTPIQKAAIPIVLDDCDLLGCAQTGSGKTAAFALPILQHLIRRRPDSDRPGVRALVLAPTRELAAQIGDCFETYAKGTRIRQLVVFGGVNKNPQVRALRRPPEVLVACPGRLLDLVQNDGLRLNDVEYVVLDEADRMLDMGFIHDVRKVMALLPEDRQTLLFSATMPPEIEKLSRRILYKPESVAVDPVSSTAPPIEQSVYFVGTKQKQKLLTELLDNPDVERALVFTRTKHGANRVAQKLEKAGIGAAAIHGNKSQGARERAMAGFRSGDIRVVVATDLASRGIDVKHLSHVINFDLPNIAETYVHRVGRTGRAGAEGVAISLCAQDERPYLRDIERLIGHKLERMGEIEAPPDSEEDEAPRRDAGRGGERHDARSGQRSRRSSRSRTRNRTGAGAGGKSGEPGGKPGGSGSKSRPSGSKPAATGGKAASSGGGESTARRRPRRRRRARAAAPAE